MPLHRRDFMKVLGVSLASLYLTRCRSPFEPEVSCYAAVPVPTNLPITPTNSLARERLRLYWLRFEELVQNSQEDTENKLGEELVAGHLAALDELVANGEIAAPVASLVQEAYEAAVYHVWRSNAAITCYITTMPDYSPSSARVLVEQATTLNQIAEEGTIDPNTLAKAREALEHDMAFYALTEAEVESLYAQLRKEYVPEQSLPMFEELPLELTPEAKEATQFIIDLLTGK